ncbi:DNA repair protein RecN [Desnuesiella massiliensis]|uniref:DNA repair protein RecN n=1 Tax=Desnuesiella massiliensis TaxID=1650662 RepID=UPI0006E33243|nr:DNA repair protein RecN [Desnuesiella massiliensis]
MLLQININNFALIEKLSIDFTKGFNVLSGETGAGKSILIDAINFVLGEKFNKDFIRTGEEKTSVEAIFFIENSKTKILLEELDIEFEDILIITRETFYNGKSIVKVNGKSILISTLKQISKTLIDIHGQHENQNLLDSSNHIFYLDSFGENNIRNVKLEYIELYKKYNEIIAKIDKLKGNKDIDKVADYLVFQIKDIDSAKLKIGEDLELEKSYSILSNAEKISNSLNNSFNYLYSTGDTSNAFDMIGNAVKELRIAEKHIDKIKTLSSSLEEMYFSLEEIIRELRDLKETVVYNEVELEKVNNRIYEISQYKKKYGKTIEDILGYKASLENKYEELVNSEKIINDLNNEKKETELQLNTKAEELHKIRKEISEVLINAIESELKYVGLEKSRFHIELGKEESFNINGKDKVQFLISTNPGEPLKPLEKVVSGGELSRIMLSLKTVFIDKDEIPIVIFDEIDTGISGRIAQCVAEKMFLISTKHQVFCVTHLPQIASMSDTHYLVYKQIIDDKTYTNLCRLSIEEKVKEIAKMIASSDVTNVTIENAKELIEIAQSKKNNLINT